jgi:hypothetical protein
VKRKGSGSCGLIVVTTSPSRATGWNSRQPAPFRRGRDSRPAARPTFAGFAAPNRPRPRRECAAHQRAELGMTRRIIEHQPVEWFSRRARRTRLRAERFMIFECPPHAVIIEDQPKIKRLQMEHGRTLAVRVIERKRVAPHFGGEESFMARSLRPWLQKRSKHLDVESPRPYQIGTDNRNVAERCSRLSAMVHGNCARSRN